LRSKTELRKERWQALRDAGAARFPGVEGRIPNYVGAEAAGRALCADPDWQAARVVKINPDSPQRTVRHLALKGGKILLLPAPKLAEEAPFLELDPSVLPEGSLWHASSIKGAFELGVPRRLEELPPIDHIVTGCVGVTRQGARLGKGGGYSDLEFGLLRELGLVQEDTPIWTTVHASQITDELPMREHDISLDRIFTPQEVIRCERPWTRPEGVLWDRLEDDKIRSIPALAARRP
jgi:5-formyltetrahydrofolate cyclo-ligase